MLASRHLQSLHRGLPRAPIRPTPFIIRAMATAAPLPGVVEITPSADELVQTCLGQRSVQSALEALHRDGIVVVKDVVDHTAIDRLNRHMMDDTRTLMARGEDGPFNYNLGNLQQSPPYDAPLMSPSIFMNPFAIQLTNAWLGSRPTLSFISSNAAVKAEHGQPVHSDADFSHPSIPFAAVVNVGLVDMSPRNGSTQLWLGTQNSSIDDQEGAHGERASGRIKLDLLEQRRTVCPPFQPTVSKGSIIIRDLRLWHAGMPNQTDDIRIMLAMIHFAPWYRQRMTLKLPNSVRDIFDNHPRLAVAVEWQEGSVDHLDAPYGNAFDFSQTA